MQILTRMRVLAVLVLVLAGLGLGPAASASVDVPGALNSGGLQRTYLLHLPPGPPAGLVLNLHGAGMTGGQQAAATNYDAVADQFGFAVAYPDGVDFSWADGRGGSVPDRQGIDDVGFLAALIDQLTAQHGIPRSRIFVTGMSAGGFMATRFGCARADLVAAIAPVSGTLGSGVACAPGQPVSVLQVHGTADSVVPYGGGFMVGRGGPSDIVAATSMADRWRTFDGCPPPAEVGGAPVRRSVATGCAAGTEVDFVTIDGGGHIWPTGSFDASVASAAFFAAHGR